MNNIQSPGGKPASRRPGGSRDSESRPDRIVDDFVCQWKAQKSPMSPSMRNEENVVHTESESPRLLGRGFGPTFYHDLFNKWILVSQKNLHQYNDRQIQHATHLALCECLNAIKPNIERKFCLALLLAACSN